MEVNIRQTLGDLEAGGVDVSDGAVSPNVVAAPVSSESWAPRLRRLGGNVLAWLIKEDQITKGVREARLAGPGYDEYHIGSF